MIKNKNLASYLIMMMTGFISLGIIAYYLVSPKDTFLWVGLGIYSILFFVSFYWKHIRTMLLVVMMVLLGLWLLSYPVGLVFALIASITLAIQITLGFYLLPFVSFMLGVFHLKNNRKK